MTEPPHDQASAAGQVPDLSQADQLFLRDWKHKRAGGKARFVVIHGVLCWGLWMAVAMSVYNVVVKSAGGWLHVAANFVTFPLGGILFGVWVWASSEKKYRKLTDEPTPGPAAET